LRRKRKTHALSNTQVQQRLDRGPRFLQLTGGNKWKYIISLDEAWLSLNDMNGIRGVFYRKIGKPTPQSWTKKGKKHAKKVICAARVCTKDVTDLYFVPPTTKVDRWFFINSILKPIVEKDIPSFIPVRSKRSSSISTVPGATRRRMFTAGSTNEISSALGERNGRATLQILVPWTSAQMGFLNKFCQHHEVLAWSCEKDDRESGLSDRKLKKFFFLSF
jgi:hypothetical protein